MANEMYFLIRGEVEIVFEKDDEYCVYNTIEAGYYFGEVDIWMRDPPKHMDTMRAATKVEMLTIARENYINAMKTFDDVAVEIAKLAKDRYERGLALRRKAEIDVRMKRNVDRHKSIPSNPFTSKGRKNIKAVLDKKVFDPEIKKQLVNAWGGAPIHNNHKVDSDDSKEKNGSLDVMEEVSKESSSDDSESDCPTTLRGESISSQPNELTPGYGEFQRKETLYDTMKSSHRGSSASATLPGKTSWIDMIRRSSKRSIDTSAVSSYTAKEIAN